MSERQSQDESARPPEAPAGKDRQFVTALRADWRSCAASIPANDTWAFQNSRGARVFPKPTVSRLAGTLTKLGYLSFSGHYGQYQLAPGVLSLGYAFLTNLDVRQIARPKMQEFAEVTQASASIAIRDRLNMVYVDTVRSSASIALQLGIGSRYPLD